MIAEIMRLFARVGADTSEFNAKMTQVSTTGKSVGKGLGQDLGEGARVAQQALGQLLGGGGLGGLIDMAASAVPALAGVTLAVKGLKAAVEAGIELQDTAQQANITADAFERIAGIDLGDGAAELREATQGAASDMQAASMAMQLMSMHLADNTTEAAELLDIATQLARLKNPNGGGDISGLLPMLTNQSALRLDEFLVSGDAVQKLQDSYEAAGMDSGAAFMRAFMEEARRTLDAVGPVVPTLAEQEAATSENLRIAFARSFEGSMPSAALGETRAVIREDKQMFAEYLNQVAEGRQIVEEYSQELQHLVDIGALASGAAEKMVWDTEGIRQGAVLGVYSAEDLRDRMEAILDAEGQLTQARGLEALRADLSNATAQAEHLEIVLGRIASGDYDARVTVSWNDQWQGGPAARAYVERMMGAAGAMPQTYGAPARDDEGWYGGGTPDTPESTSQVVARLRDQDEARYGSQRQAAADRAAADAERRAQEYQSFVSGLLQPTQVTDADMAATQMGVYQDKWDEPVRQFRMKEKGHNAYEIQQFEQDFYGGRMLDQVNWGDAEKGGGLIGAAREQLAQEEGQKNLLNTAMEKLAEAGIGMDREQVSEMLGLPADYESIGTDRATDFANGVANADLAASITDTVAKQMKDQADDWRTMGEDVADLFLEGFKNGTTPELLQAIIDAILPDVLEVVNA